LINGCWFCFKWTLAIAVVAGGVAAFCLYRQMDSQIRCRIEARLAQHYKDLTVKVAGSAQLIEGKGIRVCDLSIGDPQISGPCGELLRVEEAMFECSTDLQELVNGDPPIRRITIRRPTLRMMRLPDGSWSAGKLLPPPQTGSHPPEIVIENATVELVDPQKTPASTLVLRDVNLTVGSATSDAPGGGVRQFRGTLAGNGFRHVEFEGWLNVLTSACSLRGKAEAIELSPELRDSLPGTAAAKLAALGDLRGEMEATFQVDYDRTAAVPLRFDVTGKLVRGRLDDPRLPQAVGDIQAVVRLNNAGYTVDSLTARSGRTTLGMVCQAAGYDSSSPLTLRATVRQLDLDPSLLRVLPPNLQEAWRHYSPSGQINVDAQLEYDGRAWQPPQISVKCVNVAFSHYKFPYRLEHGSGSIDLKNDVLKVDITAFGGRQPIAVKAEASDPFHPNPAGRVEIQGGDVQIDEALLAALPEKPQEVIRALDPHGTLNAYVVMWRSRRGDPMHKQIVLDANRCSVRYAKFPYQLTDVSGRLEMFDHNWRFRNLIGKHNGARVTCDGWLRMAEKPETGSESLAPDLDRPPASETPDPVVSRPLSPIFQGSELVLNFTGTNVPIEEELRDSLRLSPHIQHLWLNLRPRGVVDLTAEFHCFPEQKKYTVGVHLDPQRDTVSIEPIAFPWRIERIQGAIDAVTEGHGDRSDGIMKFQNCRAEHGPRKAAVKIASDGHGEFHSDGRWKVCFDNLTVDQVRMDRELSEALPDRLKRVAGELNATGAMNLRGKFSLERVGSLDEPLQSQWNVRIGMQQNSLQCGGLRFENVCGEASFRGEFDGQHAASRGELALDSVSYKDYQLTRVMGPIWVDDRRILFGNWVDHPSYGGVATEATGPLQSPRSLSASVFGGGLYGDGWVTLGQTPTYAMNITLTDASLARCAQELMGGRQKLRGKLLATADLAGVGRSRNLLNGKGTIRLSEADVYELPVMLSLLKLFTINPPDQNAFSDAEIDYRIEGEHMYFDRIVFHGDAISLRGSGHMNIQTQIDLTFYALVGRSELEIPVVKQVLRAAAQQLMMIRVGGTLQNPEPHQEALPVLNQALQQIRNELESRK
jgi:hypothetical protein